MQVHIIIVFHLNTDRYIFLDLNEQLCNYIHLPDCRCHRFNPCPVYIKVGKNGVLLIHLMVSTPFFIMSWLLPA